MAKMTFSGFQVAAEDFLRIERETPEAIDKMLNAGAEITVKGHQRSIERLRLIDSGDLKNSIRPTAIRRTGIEAYLHVYPQDKDRKGTRNATKGFIHEFGSSRIKGKRWMSKGNESVKDEIKLSNQAIWGEVMKNGGG